MLQSARSAGAPGNKVSCSGCRGVKCKCIPSVDSEPKCQRCVRLDIECTFLPHQRGRKPNTHNVVLAEDASGRKRRRTGTNSLPNDIISYERSPSYHSSPGGLGPRPPSEEHVELEMPANSVYHAVANRTRFSIAGVMERDPVGSESSPTSAEPSQDDPVYIGILTMEECESLFEHYHDQLQTCVCLLDPNVHNAKYTRRRSLPLFTAVLAISSKFFRPELYESLLRIANKLVGQAIFDSVCAIEVVQAICMLHYWKKPADSSGFLRMGHAIRLAYQLDLHLPRKGPYPESELEARLAVDRERTWISLFCFDTTMSDLSDRPSMMHNSPDVDSWLERTPIPLLLPSDGQLAFAVKTSILGSEIRQIQASKASYEILQSGLRRIAEELHRSYQKLTREGAPLQLTSTSASIVKFSALAQELLIEGTSLSFAPRDRKIGLLHSCVSIGLTMLDTVIDGFARKGVMPMIEDAHSVAVASASVRLLRFSSYLDTPARSVILRKLTRVVVVCREAARGDHGSQPAYLARFIHNLLDKAQHSQQPSRAPSPTESQHPPARPAVPQQFVNAEASFGLSKPPPDFVWNEMGQLLNQQPLQPFEEDQSFWATFPTLAGAMNTPTALSDWTGMTQMDFDHAGAPSNGVQYAEHWGMLGMGL